MDVTVSGVMLDVRLAVGSSRVMDSRRISRDELAAVFAYPGVADAYQYRPPYPPEVFDVLERIAAGCPRDVLDIGAGEGALARPLARRFDHVDALDISAVAMAGAGRRRPGGRQPNLRWLVGAAETAGLDGPYALVTAGASFGLSVAPASLVCTNLVHEEPFHQVPESAG